MPVANPLLKHKPVRDYRGDFGVLILARAPRPGRCKTRLARHCGAMRAARLYRAMLEHAVAGVHAQGCGDIALVCAPDTRHPFFSQLARRYAIALVRQARGDLGQRMSHAMSWGLRRYQRVVLMGSDQPRLGDEWAADARAVLDDGRCAWLAPTHDGGYWAIGLRQAEPRLFRGPRWSTPRVARMTSQRLRALGLGYATLEARNDIDVWRDWKKLSAATRTTLDHTATMPGCSATRRVRGSL